LPLAQYAGKASVETQTNYRAAQSAAQSDRLGLWQDPDPVPPWWRKEKKGHAPVAINKPAFQFG
jgi:endonuclease YncB( thermonuclease family)